jgi:RNA polymerase sigma-70 factor (ECF subfamily)
MDEERALFWKLTEAEHVRARTFCRQLVGSREDGDDLYHDTLVSALTKFVQLRDRSAFRPWLYRIAVNNFKNRVKRSWWRKLLPLSREIEETVGGDDPDAVHAARRRLEWAFRAITPEERALVVLHEMEGWPIAELARLFGKNEGTVKMRLMRARRKMREAIVKRFYQSTAAPMESAGESEDGLCVAVRPSED